MITKRNISILILLFVVVFAAGCQKTGVEPSSTPAVAVNPTLTAPPQTSTPLPTSAPTQMPAPDPVEEQLSAMTVEEKVGQLLVAGIDGLTPGEDGRIAIQDYKVGGIILFGRNVESAGQLVELTNGLKELNGNYVNLFLGVDEEGGRVSRMPPEVAELPSAYEYVRNGGDPYLRGQVLAQACKTFGFNLDFAPSLDVWSNPNNTVIGDRAFGNTFDDVTANGPDCAYGLMDAGVVPVVKHFPGHGDTTVDSHVGLPVVSKSLEELFKEELVPFQLAMKGLSLFRERELLGVPAVMVAHILMTEIDSEYPASLSPKVVTELLREQMGFDGMVVTDDLTMGAVSDTYSVGETAVLAVEAGCDLLLVCHKTENLTMAYDALLEAVNSGRITEQRLDESVRRILTVKQDYQISAESVGVPDVAALNEKITAILP